MQEQLQLPCFSGKNVRKLIIKLVDIWFLKYTKSPRENYNYYNEIVYACLLIHNSFSAMSENSEELSEESLKIQKLIDRLDEDNASWIIKLPWKIMIPTNDTFDELISNLDHHNSNIRLWMMHLSWVVRKSLYKDAVLPLLLTNVANTLCGPNLAWGLAANYFENDAEFYEYAQNWLPPSKFKEQYMNRIHFYHDLGSIMNQATFIENERNCWKRLTSILLDEENNIETLTRN
jgi:hypothetical protein